MAPCTPREFDGPYAQRRSTRSRGRAVSPDPLLFQNTIWLEAAAHEEPVTQIREGKLGDPKDPCWSSCRPTRCSRTA